MDVGWFGHAQSTEDAALYDSHHWAKYNGNNGCDDNTDHGHDTPIWQFMHKGKKGGDNMSKGKKGTSESWSPAGTGSRQYDWGPPGKGFRQYDEKGSGKGPRYDGARAR